MPSPGPTGDPVFERDAARRPVARALPRVVILKAAVDVVGIVHVHADGVGLADAHVRKVVAGPAAVDGHVHAAVAAEHDALLVFGIPPDGSEVAEHAVEEVRIPRLARIARGVHRIGRRDHDLIVERIDLDLVERIRRLCRRRRSPLTRAATSCRHRLSDTARCR
jgi:hypothetical protein